MKLLSSSLMVLCLASGAVSAAGTDMSSSGGKMPKEQMKACDINGDMIVTKAEAMKCGMTDAQWKEFKRMQQDQIFLNELKNAG